MSAVVTQAVELAACPFCGERPGIGDPFVLHPENGCVLAGYEFGDWHKPRTEAITAWNQRHRSEAVEELVEVLEPFEIAETEFSDLPDTHPISVHTTAYPVREIMLSLADFHRVRDFLSKHRGEQG